LVLHPSSVVRRSRKAQSRSSVSSRAILKGAEPEGLPVMQPSGFELVVNRRTAVALGIIPPRAPLLSANELIE